MESLEFSGYQVFFDTIEVSDPDHFIDIFYAIIVLIQLSDKSGGVLWTSASIGEGPDGHAILRYYSPVRHKFSFIINLSGNSTLRFFEIYDHTFRQITKYKLDEIDQLYSDLQKLL